jgi:hypothetical protein
MRTQVPQFPGKRVARYALKSVSDYQVDAFDLKTSNALLALVAVKTA